MAPITPAGVASSSSIGAKDQLWTFQLRKENKAMLQEIRDLQERRQTDYADFEGSLRVATDNLAKVDARVTELERRHAEDVQSQEKFREEIAALQALMAERMASKFHQDEARYILEGGKHSLRSVPNTPDRSPRRRLDQSPQMEKIPINPRHRPNRSPQMERRIAEPRQRRPLRVTERNPSRGEEHQFQRPPPRSARRPQAQAGPSELHRPATRSQSRQAREPPSSSRPIPSAPVFARPVTPLPPLPPRTPLPVASRPVDAMPAPSGFSESQIPHLEQGTRSMREYYAKVNSMYQALQDIDNDANFDVQFVSAFLRGIEVAKNREKLVDELRQFHPSRVMENKWIDIICEWDDVEDAIHRAGLFVEAKANKRQGRFMNPRTMVETNI